MMKLIEMRSKLPIKSRFFLLAIQSLLVLLLSIRYVNSKGYQQQPIDELKLKQQQQQQQHDDDDNVECDDLRDNCNELAQLGHCTDNDNNNNNIIKNKNWMISHCPKSCNRCNELILQVPRSLSFDSIERRHSLYAIKNAYLAQYGIPQIISYENYTIHMDMIERMIQNTHHYMKNIVYLNDNDNNNNNNNQYHLVRDRCYNYNESCIEWAIDGWCTEDPYYMSKECGPVCQNCDQLHVLLKCPLPHPNDVINAWNPGDMDHMFQRIINDSTFQNKYNITILSRPNINNENNNNNNNNNNDDDDDPWIIQIDNFINEIEAKRLIDMGHTIGYERSRDVGKELENGESDKRVSNGRTSTNAWCETKECLTDPITINIYNRMEELTKIPMINSENIQLLKYELGQFYKTHHDYVSLDYDRNYGVRILTIYMYLNNVPVGGGTQFPKLKKGKLTILPKVGRAIIWPSVLNESPHERDSRTMHQALPVEGNENDVKYGANVWLHQREIVKDCM